MRRIWLSLSLLFLAFCLRAHDHVLPTGFVMEEQFASGLALPTDLKIAPDGRIFITEKGGTVRIVENGQLLSQPFYTVNTQTPNERGLGSIVLDPNFESNGYVYLYYTHPLENKNMVVRVTSSGNTAIPGSEVELIRLDELHAAFHNGGGMVFDPSGKLIIATGEGTGYVYSQDLKSTLGKIIRINPDGSIPTDNPFYAQNTGLAKAIAAYGLRNPYTMAISKTSGRIFFNDVGNDLYEEVNEFLMGKNYGWAEVEGPLNGATPPDSNYMDPIYAYSHNSGCAVVGASFYEPETNQFPPDYWGKYFFLDLCNGKVYQMDPDNYQVTEFGSGLGDSYNNLEVGPDGRLYLINIATGNLSRISYVGTNSPPLISIQPAPQIVALGEDVSFSVEATGENVNYRWYRNGTQLQSAGSNSITLSQVQLADDQTEIFVELSNQYGAVTSNKVKLTVVNGSRPSIQFQNIPPKYSAGDTIPFSALVTDPDQASVPPQALTWTIEFHHDEHYHPALSALTGVNSGSYVVETYGEVDTNVFFRIRLLAIDSSGLSGESYIDVLPRKVTMRITSKPSGIEINVDGSKETTNFDLRSVQNLNRTIKIPPYTVVGDTLYQFLQWIDGPDTLIRTFPAQNDTIGMVYIGLHEYLPSIPAVGNLVIYVDTGSKQIYYSAMEVSQVRENWDVTTPFPPGSGNSSFPTDYFSTQWTGTIHPPVTGLYTFYLYHDAKVRFYLNDSLLIAAKSPKYLLQEDTVQVWLEAGKNLDLRLEYDHHLHISRVELDWSFSIIERHPVPFAKYYPRENLTEFEEGIALFPNPSPDPIVYIYFSDEAFSQTGLKIQIFDGSGRYSRVVYGDLNNGIYPLSVSDLSAGLYYLRIFYGEKVKTLKFIKP